MKTSVSISLVLLFAGVTFSAQVSTSAKDIDLKVDQVSPNSVKASFRPYKEVKEYYVDIKLKEAFGYGMMAQYHTTISKDELQDDQRYHIDSGNTLLPGLVYEIEVSNERKRLPYGTTSFRTQCDMYSFTCETITSELSTACVSSSKLCDDVEDCDDGSDERFNEDDGTCANFRPVRPGSVGIPPEEKASSNNWFDGFNWFDWTGK